MPEYLSGFTQVDSFEPDEEYEDEYEDVYVTLDLGNIDPTLIPSSSTYRLIGMDTETPFMQLSGTVMKGRHDSLLGTELVFADTNEEEDRARGRHIKHVVNVEHRVQFKEVEIKPRQSDDKGKQKAPADGTRMGNTGEGDYGGGGSSSTPLHSGRSRGRGRGAKGRSLARASADDGNGGTNEVTQVGLAGAGGPEETTPAGSPPERPPEPVIDPQLMELDTSI